MPSAGARSALVVAITFLVALALRLHSLSGVLPYVHHPDEPSNERMSLRVARRPLVSPGFFRYPSLLYYTQAIVIRAVELESGVRVRGSVSIGVGNTRTSDGQYWLWGRGLTACFGAALCALAAWLTTALDGLASGVAVGVATTLCPSLVENARYITPDTYAAFYALAALAVSSLISTRDDRSLYVLAGVFIGLAAGTKYNLALAALGPVAAHVARVRTLRGRALFEAGAVSVAVFLATTPFALFDLHAFVEGVSYEVAHYSGGHGGAEGGALAFYGRYLWRESAPWILTAPGVFVFGDPSERRRALPLAAFVVGNVAFLSAFTVHFERNALPLLPSIFVLGAVGATAGARAVRAKLDGASRNPALALLGPALLLALLLIAAPSNASAIRSEAHKRVVNGRFSAERYIRDHLPKGSKMLLEWYGPWVDPVRYRVAVTPMLGGMSREELLKGGRYAVLSESMYGRFLEDSARYPEQAEQYRKLLSDFCIVAFFHDVPGESIVILDLRCEPTQ